MQEQNEILRAKYNNPVWLNNDKSTIEVVEHSKIGKISREQNLVVEKWNDDEKELENPLFNTIMSVYSEEEIDESTKKHNENQKQENKKEAEREKEEEEVTRLQNLFRTKLDIFNIPSINESNDREFKSQIRKAKSNVEATALTVMLMMKEMEHKNDNEDT
tara:strand:- start:983 stop:1465 length:483 start_codon:yes stop_codon:yes gene_type:complete